MGLFSWAGRTAEVFGQGIVRGLAGGMAAVGDFAVEWGYNRTTRHAINSLRGDDNQLESYDTNWADRAAEAVTWTEPQNDWERGVMTAGQVVGEVGGFVAVTVATGGVGGAAFGAARAGAGATRLGAALTTGTRAAGATARAMNPLASRAALAVEGGFGAYRAHQIFTLDQEAEENADAMRQDAGSDALNSAAEQQQFLENVLTRQGEELRTIVDEINGGGLSAEREAELRGRIDEIREEREMVESLRSPDLNDEERQRYMETLQGRYSDLGQGQAANSYVSSYTRSDSGGQLTRQFAAGGQAVPQADNNPDLGTTGPEQTYKPLTREIV